MATLNEEASKEIRTLKIGVFGGTGQEGRGIAIRLALAGFEVLIGSRSRRRATRVCERLNGALGEGELIQGGLNQEVARAARFIFLAVPFSAATELVARYADQVTPDTTWVDVTVPVSGEGKEVKLNRLGNQSGSELLVAALATRESMVAALKTVPAHALENVPASLDCDVFLCGDSAERKKKVTEILCRLPGVRVIDVGLLSEARTLEGMSALLIGVNRRYGVRQSRFRLVGL